MKCRYCKNQAILGKRGCQKCLAKNAITAQKRAKKNRLAGLCVDCSTPVVSGMYCQKHREHRRKLSRERYNRHKKSGMCCHCGKPPNNNKQFCDKCLKNWAESRERIKLKSNIYQAKVRDNFRCRLCGYDDHIVTHHIDGKGERSPNADDSLENLIALCIPCHLAITRLLSRDTQLAIQLLRQKLE